MNAAGHPALVILGTGGHAKVVIDAGRAAGHEIAGMLAKDTGTPANPDELPILGDESRLEDPAFLAAHEFLVAIGDQETRRRLTTELERRGATMATVLHPSCVVSASAVIGAGSVLLAGAIVNAGSRIGRAAILNTACSIDHDNKIGNGCQIGPGARLAGEVTCGGWAFVGTGAVVLPGRTVGENAVVGAGAVVTEDVPAGVTVVGCPARRL